MGLSFHYSGEIKDKEKLPELIEEVKTLAQSHHWKYEVYNTNFSQETDSTTSFPGIQFQVMPFHF